uniref:sialin n=1 Tax=Ciona intestinalis TaxID=7719 RepID=UPI00006A44B1|nr:sialin [Ciona intestinalis]|eukprot:XP_026696646.1 sialin [Ciona intestinalis]
MTTISSSEEESINTSTSTSPILNSNENSNKEYFKKPPTVKTWLSTRFCLAYLACFGFMNVYALRVNLSVAILSMVNSSYMEIHTHNNISDACPASPSHKNSTTGEFNWDAHKRSLVLGAFFYGYILTQLPGGYLAGRFGGKWLFGLGILCTSVLTLLTPVATRTSFVLLIILRIFEGIGEGVTFPAMHSMWGIWAPPSERSRLVSITYAGCHLGTVIAQPISGILCASTFLGGWPSVFYVFGTLGILWCIVWFIFAHSKPADHPRITTSELNYIQSNLEPKDDSVSVPWWEIATSKRVWAISIAHFCNNWGFYTLLTCLPTYLKDVLKFDIQQDGFISALPYLVMWISINFNGLLADYLREKEILNTTQTRKIFNAVAFIGPGIFLVASGFVGCNKVAAVSLICLATAFNGAGFPGFNTNHVDIGPRYAGILMGITNTWATIPGFAAPAVVGLLTENNPSRSQWRIVFYIAAGVYLTGTILYSLMATGEEQEWNRGKKKVELDQKQPLLQ